MESPYAVLKPTNSSMFSRAGYDDASWQLLLEFKSTKEIRAYQNVSPEIADEALSAESLGRWFNQNVKGNPAWSFEVLGADPATMLPKAPRPPQTDEMNVLDEDIRLCEPGWTGTTIESTVPLHGLPAHLPSGAFDTHAATYGGIDRSQTTIPAPQIHVSEVGYWPKPEEELEPSVELAVKLQGEVLGAWQTPKTAVEAVALLNEHASEIDAIITQNLQTGSDALLVRVADAASRTTASDLLNRLVAVKDKTVNLLDPFRKILHESYSFAQSKVKAGVDPIDNGVKHLKGQILTYDQAQERLRQQKIREDQEARDAEARRRQEEESQRLTLLEIGDRLEQGDEQGAQMLFETPIEVPRPYIPPAYLPPAPTKTEGQSTSTTWKVNRGLVEDDETGAAYIASITKLLRAVKDGSFAIEQAAPLLSWNFSKADKLAGAMMGAFNVPGLSAEPVSVMRVGRGKKK